MNDAKVILAMFLPFWQHNKVGFSIFIRARFLQNGGLLTFLTARRAPNNDVRVTAQSVSLIVYIFYVNFCFIFLLTC